MLCSLLKFEDISRIKKTIDHITKESIQSYNNITPIQATNVVDFKKKNELLLFFMNINATLFT